MVGVIMPFRQIVGMLSYEGMGFTYSCVHTKL